MYSPNSIIFPEGNARGEYDTRGWIHFHIYEPACYNCFIIPTETKNTHRCKKKNGWQTYFKSIGTLFQTFTIHIHKWCVPCASDVLLSKNDNSRGKTRDASEGLEYDFYFTEYDFCCVITCSDFYPLSNQINLFMVINIWCIIISLLSQLILYPASKLLFSCVTEIKYILYELDLKWDLFIGYSRHFNSRCVWENLLKAVVMNEMYSNYPRLQAVKHIMLFIATQKINKHADQRIGFRKQCNFMQLRSYKNIISFKMGDIDT